MKRFIPEKFKIIDQSLSLKAIGEHSDGVLFLPEGEHFIAKVPNTKGVERDVLVIGLNLATVYKQSNFCTYDVFIKNIIFKKIGKTGNILHNQIFFVRTHHYHHNYAWGSKNTMLGGIPYSNDTPVGCFDIEKTLSNKTMAAVWIDAFKERIAYHAARSYGQSLYYGNHSFSDRAIQILYNNPYWKLHYGKIKSEEIIAEYESSKYHKAYRYYGPLEIDATPDPKPTQEDVEIARSYCAIMSGVNVLRLNEILSIDERKLTEDHVREYYIIKRLQEYQSDIGRGYLGWAPPFVAQ